MPSSRPLRSLPSRDETREAIDRSALDAALRKAAILQRANPSGDPYGAAGQALEDYIRRADQLVVGGEDVTGWINTATERRWINELRHQRRRGYARLDAPLGALADATVGDLTTSRGPTLEESVEIREHLSEIASEQRAALVYLRAAGVQERHVRIVELALAGEPVHHEIAARVNAEFPAERRITGNAVTQVVGRQRERLAAARRFPTVVTRLRRTRRRPS